MSIFYKLKDLINLLFKSKIRELNLKDLKELPDGSGYAISKYTLPKDHWIYYTDKYGYTGDPPAPMRMGINNPQRNEMVRMLKEAGKYAIRASTSCGRDMDFDPDALVQNLIIGMLGYYTLDEIIEL